MSSWQNKIAVIVINWNGYDDTVACIKSLFAQSHDNFQIFLVDNGSNEDAGKLKDTFENEKRIKLHMLPKNIGFTPATNLVLTDLLATNFEYVAMINNDTVCEPNCLEEMLHGMQKLNCDMISSKMIQFNHSHKMDNAGHFMLNTAEILPIGYNDSITQYNEVKNNIGPCAGGALYRVKLFKEVGLFDTFFNTGYEDAEFGLRACLLGFKSYYWPKAIIHHKGGASLKKVRNLQYITKIQQDIFYTYLKLMPTYVVIFNLPFIIAKYIVVLLMDLLMLRFSYFKMTTTAIYKTLFTDKHKWKQARQNFKNQQNYKYLKMVPTTFFLWFDLKRFFKLIFKRKTNFA